MTGKITKAQKQPGKYSGFVWFICFAMEDGHSARTWVNERNGNFKRWQPVIMKFLKSIGTGEEVILSKLAWTNQKSRLVNGDSFFDIVKQQPKAQEQPHETERTEGPEGHGTETGTGIRPDSAPAGA